MNFPIVPVISVIGSCRVHNPMRALRNADLIKLNNSRLREFCHSPREALQKIRVANNRMEIPENLSIFVNGVEAAEKPAVRADFSKTDIFLIEISSLRRLSFQGVELQLNFITDFLVKKYNLEQWFFELSEMARAAPLGRKVKHLPNVKNLPDNINYLASSLEMSMETDEVISEMISKISDYLRKPILFSGHFDVLKNDGRRVQDRVRLNDCVKNAAEKLGHGFFNPSDLFNDVGIGLALRDNNHWNYEFEKDAGNFILNKKIIPMLRG